MRTSTVRLMSEQTGVDMGCPERESCYEIHPFQGKHVWCVTSMCCIFRYLLRKKYVSILHYQNNQSGSRGLRPSLNGVTPNIKKYITAMKGYSTRYHTQSLVEEIPAQLWQAHHHEYGLVDNPALRACSSARKYTQTQAKKFKTLHATLAILWSVTWSQTAWILFW